MKLRYALCDCNLRESAELFRTKLIICLYFVTALFAFSEIYFIFSTLIHINQDSLLSIENDIKETFYQTCFNDSQFTVESHRLLHKKCLQLRNESIWVTHLPKATLNNVATMLGSYENLKAYLDSQKENLNLTECFTELRENILNEVVSRKTHFLTLYFLFIIITILFGIIATKGFFKLRETRNDENKLRLLWECLGYLIISSYTCSLFFLGFFPLQDDINDLEANAMNYFVDMC